MPANDAIPRCKRCAYPLAMVGQAECSRCGGNPARREPIPDTAPPARRKDCPVRLYSRVIVQSATGVYSDALIGAAQANDDGTANGWCWASVYLPKPDTEANDAAAVL